jgi:hypothetical protein
MSPTVKGDLEGFLIRVAFDRDGALHKVFGWLDIEELIP